MTNDTIDPLLPPPGPMKIEYVYVDENPIIAKVRQTGHFGPFPMKNVGDKVFYGTGISYMAGLAYGGVYGTWRGFRTAKVPAFKVRMNNVANQVGRYGTWAGNSMGIMTMQWAIIDSMYSYIRGETDYYNHVGAAFTSGYLFKVTAGQRPAIVTGALLASAVSAFGLIDTFVLSERIVGVPTPAVPSLNTN